MNGQPQIQTKIDFLEKELRELKKALEQKAKKPLPSSVSVMKSLWKKLKVSDEELTSAKKAVFNFGR